MGTMTKKNLSMRQLYERKWYCFVFHSGAHNGVYCNPDEPHAAWGCDYRWIAPPLTDKEARLLPDEQLREAEPIDGYVWCDLEGSVHEDEPNPYGIVCTILGHYTLLCAGDPHEKNHSFVCPGPHSPMYKLQEDEL